MITREEALSRIKELADRFEEQYDSYKSASYNETLTRRDFIDPFFKALGWDIDNSLGYAEAYREVIHEDKIKGTSSRLQKLKFENADTASRLRKSIFPIAKSCSGCLQVGF